nr:hypothetical protein [Tanacetum cinerariifolium]
MLARQYNHNGEGTSRFSRMSKLEFPNYYRDDMQGWMFRVKQFFSIDNVPKEDKVRMVSIHMYDTALTWHLQFIKSHGETVTWYGSSIKDYQSNFERLLNFVDITESQSISMFIAGLLTAIELNVRMFRPRHKCEGKMFALEIKGIEGEKCLEKDDSDMIEYELSETPHISLNALSGVPTHNTMRVKG